MVPAMTRMVQSVDKDARMTNVETLEQVLSDSAAEPRFQTGLVGSFGVLGLVLAIVGVYGVISYSVVQKTHEIGVRMALGAGRRDVVRMILKEGMVLAVSGIAIGTAGALALTRVLRGMLYEIAPTDPATFVGVTVFLTIAALAACYLPARRATCVDPMRALRSE
jgi:putative ABC transport system permease protein